MDKMDWFILNCLADDYESIKQIYPMVQEAENVSLEEIQNRIITLYQDGYVCLEAENVLNIEMLKQDMDFTEYSYSKFRFGLSSKGAMFWEDNAIQFGGFKKDWDNAWRAALDYQSGTGYVCGTTREICEMVLKDHFEEENDVVVDESSLEYAMIDRFKAQYYKTIEGGVKLNFRFCKRNQ